MTKVTLLKGDGIGPEISEAVIKVLDYAGADIDWDCQIAGAEAVEKYNTALPENTVNSIRRNKTALKAPITTPIGKGFRSVNVQLRKELNLFANVRPCKNIPNIKTRFDNVDIVVVRENTEDLYAGIEKQIDDNTAQSIKIITRDASLRISEYAFDYAVKNNRIEVCAVTKANICKLSDGLFLQCARETAEKYPQIKYREMLVDNCCMQLVQNPGQFDVLLLPNLYGDIVSDLTAGLVGGLGIAKSVNTGKDCAVFEAVHGSAPDIKGLDKANPTALLLSAVDMLKYIGQNTTAYKIEKALYKTLSDNIKTADIGGNARCSEFVRAIIENLEKN
ncbi:MAG: isocitrate/isopropylmalate dehydrogenase family protein [Candidatus Gastranaerophilales bacterium]|nr:isocitrate/isopropylmalate dehydrogenase family protein [Candidatus Gastranaerophilales bacterium]